MFILTLSLHLCSKPMFFLLSHLIFKKKKNYLLVELVFIRKSVDGN